MSVIGWEVMGSVHQCTLGSAHPWLNSLNKYFQEVWIGVFIAITSALWKPLVVIMAEFFIARAACVSFLDPKTTLPGAEDDKTNNKNASFSAPTCPFSYRKGKNYRVFFERLFRSMSFGCCLVAQSCSQLAYSAHETSHKNVIWTFRITKYYMIQSQKLWALNERGQISEMERLLCSSFWLRCGLLQE